MKRQLAWALASFTLAIAGHAGQPKGRSVRGSATQILERIETDWAKALIKADKTELDRIEAPEYTVVTATGAVLTKAQADGELLNGNQHFDALEISDLTVHRSCSLAVVTGHASSRERYKSQDNSGDYEFIDSFEKRGRSWLAIHAQLTRITHPDK
jgi:ketosteroid isomerase-like protein